MHISFCTSPPSRHLHKFWALLICSLERYDDAFLLAQSFKGISSFLRFLCLSVRSSDRLNNFNPLGLNGTYNSLTQQSIHSSRNCNSYVCLFPRAVLSIRPSIILARYVTYFIIMRERNVRTYTHILAKGRYTFVVVFCINLSDTEKGTAVRLLKYPWYMSHIVCLATSPSIHLSVGGSRRFITTWSVIVVCVTVVISLHFSCFFRN